jgi:hypothetical protein
MAGLIKGTLALDHCCRDTRIVLIPLWAFSPSLVLLTIGALLLQFMVQGASFRFILVIFFTAIGRTEYKELDFRRETITGKDRAA